MNKRQKYNEYVKAREELLAKHKRELEYLSRLHELIEDTLKQQLQAKYNAKRGRPAKGSRYLYEFLEDEIQIMLATPEGYLGGVCFVKWEELDEQAARTV